MERETERKTKEESAGSFNRQMNSHNPIGKSRYRFLVEHKFRNPGNLKKEIEENEKHQS